VYEINGQPTDLTDNDVMTIAEAAKRLGVTGQTVSYYIEKRRLTAVTQPGKQTARRKPKRWVLCSDVDALAQSMSIDDPTP
jgi:excisionase family DNA binding protein